MIPIFENPSHVRHSPRFETFRGNRSPATETPERYEKLAASLRSTPLPLEWHTPGAEAVAAARTTAARVHGPERIEWLEWVCAQLDDKKQYIPDVFAPAAHFRPEQGLVMRREAVGEPWRGEPLFARVDREWYAWFCFDTHTPIVSGTAEAALGSAAAAVAAAMWLRSFMNGASSPPEAEGGAPPALAVALCRPPGHHAGRDYYGGFCYLNNAALAAEVLRAVAPRVAIFDFDYHHGNGTQDIFYARSDVFYCSIHGAPPLTYPFFAGFADERGAGRGVGANLNLPLDPAATAEQYRAALAEAMAAVAAFEPSAIVVSAGFDCHADDPIGGFPGVMEPEIAATGSALRALGRPLLVVLEGGYSPERLGPLMETFLRGATG
ncbi:MAG: histone deacetylase family protein [Candidatus Sumerlaeia bacterium]